MNDRDPGYGDWPPRAEWDEGGSSVFGGRRDDGWPHTASNGRRGAGYDDPWSGGGYGGAAGPRDDDPRSRDPWPHGAADDRWPHDIAGNGGYGDRWGPRSGAADPGGHAGYQGATARSSGDDRRWQQSGYVQPWEHGRASTLRGDPRPTSPYGSPPAGDRPRRSPPPGGRSARKPDRDRDRDGRGFPFGLGALFGLVGLACFLAGLIVLPWFEVAGEGVTLADIRSSFTPPETDPADLGIESGSPTTLPGGIPTPEEVTDVVEQEVREQAAEAAAGAVDSGKSRYLKLYANTLWMAAAGGVAAAVLFATILAPRSAAMSLLVGLRRLSFPLIVLAAAAHGAALWVVFSGDGPSPALGVWLGVGGLVAVFAGCILGPKR